ncbi:MAG: hypothetical protein B7Y07_05825 [Halothiobacillus sp. 24-54-40]|jgi:hypothetical protein|nr:MAG: hypothetical protein B7Y58_06185 [Halothiobacillus sp. 35-54-62]OYZ87012.1 MAG: hypothetical protein B7Y07_05825 [Halothiobacillus sp. 24-54-40]OZA80400.1 MAG: hypothetical protein B7X64_06020 [Halothiobacillus sp. 39-53-45]
MALAGMRDIYLVLINSSLLSKSGSKPALATSVLAFWQSVSPSFLIKEGLRIRCRFLILGKIFVKAFSKCRLIPYLE